MTSPEENSIFNLERSKKILQFEKWVIACELGIEEADLIEQIIESCDERMAELNAQHQLGNL